MSLLSILPIAGIAVACLISAGGLFYFAYQIWACAVAHSKGGSRCRRRSSGEDATYEAARASYVAHRDRAGRGMIVLILGILAGTGFGIVADLSGGSRAADQPACQGVELCEE
jgi:hypothetical protein